MLIDRAGILDLIPHSGDMCLLDAVLSCGPESIVCVSRTHRSHANPLCRDGRLSALHAFEYGAQAVAVHGALQARSAGVTPPPSYLAALRDARLYRAYLDDIAALLEIQATRLFGEAGSAIYRARVSADDRPVAEGRITVMMRAGSK
jgi:Predicted 3-hydroxylacyl-(acyl carrier protein) dehydratase